MGRTLRLVRLKGIDGGRAAAVADAGLSSYSITEEVMSKKRVAMTVVRFTEKEMEDWREADKKTPRTRKLFDLAMAHAEREGGQTLELWKHHMGRLWGVPIMMTIDEAALQMNIPVSRARQIYDDSIEAIRPEWEASPEYHVSWDPGA